MGNSSGKDVYEFGDFRLDAGHLMLYHGDEELALAPKAVETLVALVEHRGEIMSKDELLEVVWPDTVVEESNLFVYLSVLRKTLGTKENGDPWVETLRRRGYRFSGDVRLVPKENNGNGIPAINAEPLKLVPATPSGNPSPTTPLNNIPLPRRGVRRTVLLAVGFASVLAVVAFTYPYIFTKPINSIAVIPFVDATQDPELEYLPVRMTENLIASLSKIADLKVEELPASSGYKETDPRTIGIEMGVAAVLYGRVTKRGEDIELHAELVDSQTGVRLWEATETQRISDLIVLERQIERDVTSKLRPRRPGTPELETSSKYPKNSEAYPLYLKGRTYCLKLTEPQIEKGLEYLYQAVAKDPSYARAYAIIARAHLFLGIAGEKDPSEFVKARDAARRAIELDGTLAEGYSALGSVAFFYERNFTEAESLYKRAVDLDPQSSTVHQQYSDFLNRTGRREESAKEIARAWELDPDNPFITAFYALSSRNPDEALSKVRFAIDVDPNHYLPHMMAATIYMRKEMYEESIAESHLAKQLAPGQTLSDVGLINALVQVGRTTEARGILDKMLRDSKTRFIPPYHLACVYKHLGEKDKAFDYLEKGIEDRDPKMVFLNESVWNDYRDELRFQDVMRRVGFPQ